MSVGRILSSCAASAAVVGATVLAVGMAHSGSRPAANVLATPTVATHTPRPAYLPAVPSAAASGIRGTVVVAPPTARPALTTAVATTGAVASTGTATRPATSPPARPSISSTPATRPVSTPHRSSAPPAPRASTTHAAPAPHVTTGRKLPLSFTTGTATRVITVTAPSAGSTTATLQAWTKAAGGGWTRYGSSVYAHVGADGLSRHASESRSATPIGSFTLTQAFGYDSDPGTTLPYLHTTRADWWISEPGRLYNTHQRCSSGCAFTPGAPNEHLYYERPYYAYGVVIDYNTRNAPGGVRAGAGSAFFLHVTDGAPTAGCVAIPQSRLVPLLRWLRPSAHPRILIGVT